MPENELIDSYVDRPSITDDTKFLTDQLKTVLELFDKVNATKFTLQGAKSMQEVTDGAKAAMKATDDLAKGKAKLIDVDLAGIKAINENAKAITDLNAGYKELIKQSVQNEIASKQLAAARKTLNDQFKAGQISAEELAKGLETIKEADIAVKVSNQDLGKALKNLEKDAQSAEGSLDKLRAQLNLSLQAFDRLSEVDKQSDVGKGLKQQIVDLTNVIKKEEEETLRFQRNVGNYQGSAKIIVDALDKAKEKFKDLSQAADSSPAALQRASRELEALQRITEQPQFLKVASKFGDASTEVRFFSRQLVAMQHDSSVSGDTIEALKNHIAKLTDEIGDTRTEIKKLSSDTRVFDEFADSIKFAADVFQTYAGAAALAGQSDKEIEDQIKTLVAVQSVANGVKGIATELTTKGTVANKLFSFAQKEVAIAFDTTATSAARLRGALITLGIGALIVGIGLLIANFDKLKSAFSGLSKQQQILADVQEKAIDNYVEEKVAVEQLLRESLNENTAKERKVQIINILHEKSSVYFDDLKSEKDLQEKGTEAVKKYIKAIELKAEAQAATSILAEKEKAVVQRQIELQRDLQLAKDATFDSEARKQRAIAGIQKTINDGTDKELVALKKNLQPIQAVIDNINKQLQDVGGDPSKITNTLFAKQKQFDDEDLKRQADRLKKISEGEDVFLISRVNARQKAAEIEKQILQGQKNTEIENINAEIALENTKSTIDIGRIRQLNEQKVTVQTAFNKQQRRLQEDLNSDLITIRQSFIAHERALEKEALEQFAADEKARNDLSLQSIQKEHDRRLLELAGGQESEIKALNDEFEKKINATRVGSRKREKVEQEFANRRADIEYSYAVATLQTEIELAKRLIALRKSLGEDTAAAEKELANAEIALSDLVTKHKLDNNKRQAKSEKDKLDDIAAGIEIVQQIQQKVGGIISGLVSAETDRQKNAIQDQIDEIEKKKNKEIEAINATSASDDEKANKIKVIEEVAAARKAQLEQKQRQLDIQRAKFEKARAVGEIVVNTALAVVKALPNIPLAIAVGALGAAELGVAIATPIPRFKRGREKGPATLAVVGDGGVQEVITSPDLKQSFLTPAHETTTYLPEDWKVFPDVDAFQQAARKMSFKPVPVAVSVNNGNDRMLGFMMREMRGLKMAVMSKQENHFHWSNGELKKAIKNGENWTRYVQDNI